MDNFLRVSKKITPENYSSRVKSITVKLYVHDCSGKVWITDIFLQAGTIATGWAGHPSEIRWTLDG